MLEFGPVLLGGAAAGIRGAAWRAGRAGRAGRAWNKTNLNLPRTKEVGRDQESICVKRGKSSEHWMSKDDR